MIFLTRVCLPVCIFYEFAIMDGSTRGTRILMRGILNVVNFGVQTMEHQGAKPSNICKQSLSLRPAPVILNILYLILYGIFITRFSNHIKTLTNSYVTKFKFVKTALCYTFLRKVKVKKGFTVNAKLGP